MSAQLALQPLTLPLPLPLLPTPTPSRCAADAYVGTGVNVFSAFLDDVAPAPRYWTTGNLGMLGLGGLRSLLAGSSVTSAIQVVSTWRSLAWDGTSLYAVYGSAGNANNGLVRFSVNAGNVAVAPTNSTFATCNVLTGCGGTPGSTYISGVRARGRLVMAIAAVRSTGSSADAN